MQKQYFINITSSAVDTQYKAQSFLMTKFGRKPEVI